ncbi:hypothetical protein [Staphylococcus sp. FSL R7-0694]|uniref:hypothetical protein n=1 Tax=Staphylococcus sp. FSL R7-0694 TaxID=2921727 RepID=UPI0030FD626F
MTNKDVMKYISENGSELSLNIKKFVLNESQKLEQYQLKAISISGNAKEIEDIQSEIDVIEEKLEEPLSAKEQDLSGDLNSVKNTVDKVADSAISILTSKPSDYDEVKNDMKTKLNDLEEKKGKVENYNSDFSGTIGESITTVIQSMTTLKINIESNLNDDDDYSVNQNKAQELLSKIDEFKGNIKINSASYTAGYYVEPIKSALNECIDILNTDDLSESELDSLDLNARKLETNIDTAVAWFEGWTGKKKEG